jgi:two-component system sensor histidine kinase BaeS
MLNTLRRRLILSHALPLLVIIPIMGIALVYALETQVVLADLANELTSDAALVAELSKNRPDLWGNPAQAEAFVAHLGQYLTARVMLLDPSGQLLASSDATDTNRLGQRIELPVLATALAGEVSVHTAYSRHLGVEIADVLTPVLGPDQQVAGLIRLSHRLATVQEQFMRLRYLSVGILLLGTLPGIALGWILALNLERPLTQVTQAAYGLARGERLPPLAEEGPEEIQLLSRAINTLVERLRSLEQARRQLLANLVHELGRPLGALRAASQALLAGANQDAVLRRELLLGMVEELGRLRGLLNDLAHLQDQVLGTLELDRQPIALDDWLLRLLVTWRERAQEKGIHWQTNIPPPLPTLKIDPDRLAQVIGNLLSNAIRYTPTGGKVSIDAGVAAEAVWVQVSDTGPGITPEEQAKIFTPFYRGNQTDRFPQGRGLGLSIANDLAIAHGGRLTVESTPGLGSHFTLWLPLAPHEDD